MNRPLPGSVSLDGLAKRPAVDGGAQAAQLVLASALLQFSPGLAVPGPRKAWGLDRLVLDNAWGESVLRSLLRSGGTDLHVSFAATSRRDPSLRPLVQSCILSLPGNGQGLAVGVGLAIGQTHLHAIHGSLFKHRVFVLCSDAALPGAIASESSSLAGHLKLSSLVILCFREGFTGTEDTAQRYEAYGWAVVDVALNEVQPLLSALEATKDTNQPTLIFARPPDASTGAVLSADECRNIVQAGADMAVAWEKAFSSQASSDPALHGDLVRRFSGQLPENWQDNLPIYQFGERAGGTRNYSAKVLGHLVSELPEMIGGSADLTSSNLTNQAGLKDFQHSRPQNRYIRFGVREHGMQGICTGLAAYGCFLPFCSTFTNFVTYGWGAVRLAASAAAQVIYVTTHDSIELGEDGPTHQPIECLSLFRALPNLLTFRPADGTETVGAYETAILARGCPSLLALCRGGTPHLKGSSREGVARGGYIVSDFDGGLPPLVVFAGSGTEVALCCEAKDLLQTVGVGARVVSIPCWELLEQQDKTYYESLFSVESSLPSNLAPVRVYAEAGSTLGFNRFGEVHVGMTTFGASGNAKDVKKHFGFEKVDVAHKVMEALQAKRLVESFKVGRFGFCKFSKIVQAAMTD